MVIKDSFVTKSDLNTETEPKRESDSSSGVIMKSNQDFELTDDVQNEGMRKENERFRLQIFRSNTNTILRVADIRKTRLGNFS